MTSTLKPVSKKRAPRKAVKSSEPLWQRERPSLEAKLHPAQQRSSETYERILETGANTLADVGIERLSTNLICERAGLTPPALYRYFPNKYALLSELGLRLMNRQNAVVANWITEQLLSAGVKELESALAGLLLETYQVTRDTPGGVWIMRALRAVPPLQQVRVESHRLMTTQQASLFHDALPHVDPDKVTLVCRIVVELIYAAVEMLFDEDLEPLEVATIVASMMASQLEQLQGVSSQVASKSRR